jgi:hypothetical protein
VVVARVLRSSWNLKPVFMKKVFTRSANDHSEHETGLNMARLLSGVWRENSEPPNLSQGDLAAILLQLCQSGAGALAWWRIRGSALATSPSGIELQKVYRRFRLSALIHAQEIKHVFSLLRTEGIEPVLVKGWSIARLYPDRALRPYGDIDLCVRPDLFAKARAAMKPLEKIDGHYVDLHAGFANIGRGWQSTLECGDLSPLWSWGQRSRGDLSAYKTKRDGGSPHSKKESSNAAWNELFDRSQLVDLDGEDIRVLCAEDHLRILCLHFLRSGAWRPPWLCDVAIALETRAREFNWGVCLGRDCRQAKWVVCTIELANQLLGADCSHAPVEKKLPHWLAPAVLAQWGRIRDPNQRAMALPELFKKTIGYRTFFGELCARWNNPVRATVRLGGSFNDWPRWPYQLGELFLRSPEIPRQLASMFLSSDL